VITAALHEADLGEARFDRVLAVHFPPLLRGDPARELAVVRRHLAAGGALHVVAQPVAAQEARSAAAAIAATLARHGFTPDPPRVASLADRPIVCVVARRDLTPPGRRGPPATIPRCPPSRAASGDGAASPSSATAFPRAST